MMEKTARDPPSSAQQKEEDSPAIHPHHHHHAPTSAWKSPPGVIGFAEFSLLDAVYANDPAAVRLWLSRGAKMVHYNAPYSLLWIACDNGFVCVLRELLLRATEADLIYEFEKRKSLYSENKTLYNGKWRAPSSYNGVQPMHAMNIVIIATLVSVFPKSESYLRAETLAANSFPSWGHAIKGDFLLDIEPGILLGNAWRVRRLLYLSKKNPHSIAIDNTTAANPLARLPRELIRLIDAHLVLETLVDGLRRKIDAKIVPKLPSKLIDVPKLTSKLIEESLASVFFVGYPDYFCSISPRSFPVHLSRSVKQLTKK